MNIREINKANAALEAKLTDELDHLNASREGINADLDAFVEQLEVFRSQINARLDRNVAAVRNALGIDGGEHEVVQFKGRP